MASGRTAKESRAGFVTRVVVAVVIVGLVVWRVSKDQPKGKRRSRRGKQNLDEAFDDLMASEEDDTSTGPTSRR